MGSSRPSTVAGAHGHRPTTQSVQQGIPEDLYPFIDQGWMGHVGYDDGGQPVVLPAGYVRIGDVIYLHHLALPAGNGTRRSFGSVVGPVCLTITLLDGLVLGRSSASHGFNYQCAVIVGHAFEVGRTRDREAVLAAAAERVSPGRSRRLRRPTAPELASVTIVGLDVDAAYLQGRTGDPVDGEDDLDASVWAGVVPLRLCPGAPRPARNLGPSAVVPAGLGYPHSHHRDSAR